MAEEDEGAIGADWAMGAEGGEGAMGSEGIMGAEEDKGGCYIFNVRWLGHHWNRLYGFMGLRSKMSDGVDGVEWMDTP